jgi:hypothetical protein
VPAEAAQESDIEGVVTQCPRQLDSALDRIGGGERLAEAIGKAEGEDGERLVQSFAHAGRRARIAVFQAACEILEHAARDRDVGLFVGARHDRADPRTLAFR